MTTQQDFKIRTARLCMRLVKYEDIALLDALNRDEGVMQYLARSPPPLTEVCTMVQRATDQLARGPPFGLWIAIETATGAFLGWFQLGEYDGEQRNALITGNKEGVHEHENNRQGPSSKDEVTEIVTHSTPLSAGFVLEIGYRLHKHAWGRGLATEGCLALLEHAFAVPTVSHVTAVTMFTNHRSRRVMIKTGLKYVTTFHVQFDDPLPGTELGEVFYAISRDEWKAIH